MGCIQSRPSPRPRYDDSKTSHKSSNEHTGEAVLFDFLWKSAFFAGLTKEDATRIAATGVLIQHSEPTLVLESGQQFLLGGVALVTADSHGTFIAKRRDIYGEDCFATSDPRGIFAFKRSLSRDMSDGRVSRRESNSREGKDYRDSGGKEPETRKSSILASHTAAMIERFSSKDEIDDGAIELKLNRLERRQIARYSRKDFDEIAENSPTLQGLMSLLDNRARFRSIAGFMRSGVLARFKPNELKNFALGFDFCTLDTVQKHFSSHSSSLGNFYYICDGALEVTITMPSPRQDSRVSTAGSAVEENEDEASKTFMAPVGRLGEGCFVSETVGLLRMHKRFANKLSYTVAEKGVALYISAAYLENYLNFVLTESTKQMLEKEAHARQPKMIRKSFPVFHYLSDECIELLMEACESITLSAGEDVPRSGDFHLVRQGSVITSGIIKRKSAGGGLYVSNSQTAGGGATTPTTTMVFHQGDFFSPEGLIKIFNARKTGRECGGNAGLQFFPTGSPVSLTPVDSMASLATEDSEDAPVSNVTSSTFDAASVTVSTRATANDTIIWIFPSDLVAFTLSREPLWAADLELRALRENASIEAVIKHPVACMYFRNYLAACHADENLDFCLAVAAYQSNSLSSFYPLLGSAASSPQGSIISAPISPLTGLTRSLSGKITRIGSGGGLASIVLKESQVASAAESNASRDSTSGVLGDLVGGVRDRDSGAATPEPDKVDDAPLSPSMDNAALAIYYEFIDESSRRQINIASTMRDEIRDIVLRPHGSLSTISSKSSSDRANVFLQAQQECLKILNEAYHNRFKQTSAWADMMRDILNGTNLREAFINSESARAAVSQHHTQIGASASMGSTNAKASPLRIAKRRLSSSVRSSPSRGPVRLSNLADPSQVRLAWEVIDWASGPVTREKPFELSSPHSRRADSRGESSPGQRRDSRESSDVGCFSPPRRQHEREGGFFFGGRDTSPTESVASRKLKEGTILGAISEADPDDADVFEGAVSLPTKKISSTKTLFREKESSG